MSALEQQLFLKENSFNNLDALMLENYKLDMKIVGKVLTSNGVALDIPYNINGRTTQINSQIVLTSLWIYIKQFMDLDEIHEIMKAYEQGIKEAAKEMLPLTEININTALRPIGRVMPQSLLIMWCKKCWQFLECAKN